MDEDYAGSLDFLLLELEMQKRLRFIPASGEEEGGDYSFTNFTKIHVLEIPKLRMHQLVNERDEIEVHVPELPSRMEMLDLLGLKIDMSAAASAF